jgi:hypothetical protein
MISCKDLLHNADSVAYSFDYSSADRVADPVDDNDVDVCANRVAYSVANSFADRSDDGFADSFVDHVSDSSADGRANDDANSGASCQLQGVIHPRSRLTNPGWFLIGERWVHHPCDRYGASGRTYVTDPKSVAMKNDGVKAGMNAKQSFEMLKQSLENTIAQNDLALSQLPLCEKATDETQIDADPFAKVKGMVIGAQGVSRATRFTGHALHELRAPRAWAHVLHEPEPTCSTSTRVPRAYVLHQPEPTRSTSPRASRPYALHGTGIPALRLPQSTPLPDSLTRSNTIGIETQLAPLIGGSTMFAVESDNSSMAFDGMS